MCAFGAGTWDKISDKFRHIATILEICDNFRQSTTVLDKKKATILNRFLCSKIRWERDQGQPLLEKPGFFSGLVPKTRDESHGLWSTAAEKHMVVCLDCICFATEGLMLFHFNSALD